MTETENDANDIQRTNCEPEKINRDELQVLASEILRILHCRTTTRRFKAGKYDRSRLSYARVAVAAITAYGTLLKDSEIVDLEKRIERLEKKE
jgi:hypothetical protein